MTTPTGAAELPEALRFTKKPVTIEAIQWTRKNLRAAITFTDGPPDTRSMHAGMAWEAYADLVARDGLKIYTLEGKMLANVGDWIIRGVKGEYYPCKPDIFEATYSPAAQVEALSAAQAGVPDGYALVPKESTAAMQWAFARAETHYRDGIGRAHPMDNVSAFKSQYAAMLAAAPQPQAPAQEPASDSSIKLAEMLLSDCGHSSNNTRLLERVATRIDKHVERALEMVKTAPAAQGDALDATRPTGHAREEQR